MPIRFRCVYCGQLLSIATRKAGTQVDCPKCKHQNQVPNREKERKAATTRAAKATRALESKRFDEWIGRSDKPDVPEQQPDESPFAGGADSDSDVIESTGGGGSDSASAVEEPWRTEPEVLPAEENDSSETLSRGTAILLSVLAVVLLLVAFGLGVVVGRFAFPTRDIESQAGDAKVAHAAANVPGAQVNDARPATAPLALTGKIEFQPEASNVPSPDDGSLVIALSADSVPASNRRVPGAGLKPGEPPAKADLKRLEEIGGRAVATGLDGTFRLELPHDGTYWILVLSHRSARSPSTQLFRSEQETLEQYFDALGELIGSRGFLLVNRVIKPDGISSLNYVFRSGG